MTAVTDNNGDVYEPDLYAAVNAATMEFAVEASAALKAFRDRWMRDHSDDKFAMSLELDLVPILWDGNMHGFIVIDEIDGETYCYAPARRKESA